MAIVAMTVARPRWANASSSIMIHYALSVVLPATIISAFPEIAKRNSAFPAAIALLPVTSVLAFVRNVKRGHAYGKNSASVAMSSENYTGRCSND